MKQIDLQVGTGSRILIERGLAANLAAYRPFENAHSAFVVTDDNVAALYLDRTREQLVEVGCSRGSATFPPGEHSKSIESLTRLYECFVDEGLDRGSVVVALGGGVVGDLAGYAASTYMRGARFVQVPTTLLAQVDAAIGGKTAVNFRGLKNLVGTFYQPEAVLIDPEVLRTLPQEHLRNGFAEVVKAGIIGDAGLFELIEKQSTLPSLEDSGLYEEIIFRAASVKVKIVEQDEREAGLRRVLNLGHTIGHALEESKAFAGVLHGEAVAVGMVLEAKLAQKLGMASGDLSERLCSLLEKLGFRLNLKGTEPDRLTKLARYDKKTRAGKLVFALPVEIGNVEIREDVDPLAVKEVLEEAAS
jgi:3-dehydroquinate synthase